MYTIVWFGAEGPNQYAYLNLYSHLRFSGVGSRVCRVCVCGEGGGFYQNIKHNLNHDVRIPDLISMECCIVISLKQNNVILLRERERERERERDYLFLTITLFLSLNYKFYTLSLLWVFPHCVFELKIEEIFPHIL